MQGTSLGSGALEYAAVEEKVEWGKLYVYEPMHKCMQFSVMIANLSVNRCAFAIKIFFQTVCCENAKNF